MMAPQDDLSPPESPTEAEIADALRKGLGRSVTWAREGRIPDALLLEACLNDWRYDRQCEERRGAWLATVVEAAGKTEAFRTPVFMALKQNPAGKFSTQHAEIVVTYARKGDTEALELLYETCEAELAADDYSPAENLLLEIAPLTAYPFLIERHGRCLLTRSWDWTDKTLWEWRLKAISEEAALEELGLMTNEHCTRFLTAVRNRPEPTRPSHVLETHQPVDRLLSDAQSPEPCRWFSVWGTKAVQEELCILWKAIRQENASAPLINLLQVFSRRALPEFDPYLIQLCRHGDPKVRFRAEAALAMNAHPDVRQFALELLKEPSPPVCPVILLQRNFQHGDEDRIIQWLTIPEDSEKRHSLFFNIIDLLDDNDDADLRPLCHLAYFYMPCSICRDKAARMLYNTGTMPKWMLNECRDDAASRIRELVADGGPLPENECSS